MNNKTKVVVGVSLKKAGYIIPIINCYTINGQLRDPNFTRHKLYYPKQYRYLQHLIFWVVLNISTMVLRIRLIRERQQHFITQIRLTLNFKTSLVRNSNKLVYKTQKPCNENQSLESTELFQTQRFIESWSISTALITYKLWFSQVLQYYDNNIVSKLYCTCRNHVAILKKNK